MLNLSIRFLLELCGLAVYAYWGYKIGTTTGMKVFLCIAFPLSIATIWGLFGSPKASVQLSAPMHLTLEIIIFMLTVVLLLSLGKVSFAWFYGLLVVGNKILMWIWDQ